MEDKHLKELWEMRFQKVYNLEKEAIGFYKHLLQKNKSLLKGTEAKAIIKQIMKDEGKHARIAHHLLCMVREKRVQGNGRSFKKKGTGCFCKAIKREKAACPLYGRGSLPPK